MDEPADVDGHPSDPLAVLEWSVHAEANERRLPTPTPSVMTVEDFRGGEAHELETLDVNPAAGPATVAVPALRLG